VERASKPVGVVVSLSLLAACATSPSPAPSDGQPDTQGAPSRFSSRLLRWAESTQGEAYDVSLKNHTGRSIRELYVIATPGEEPGANQLGDKTFQFDEAITLRYLSRLGSDALFTMVFVTVDGQRHQIPDVPLLRGKEVILVDDEMGVGFYLE
jgi:hypothetical protein